MSEKKNTGYSSMLWGLLNDLRGVLDPEFDAFAEWMAGKIPEGSFLRSDAVIRGFGILKQFAERSGKNVGPAGNFFLEAVTDLGNYITAALRGENKVEPGKSPLDGWIKGFMKSAGERLAKATDYDIELKKLEQEFQARLNLARFVEEAISQELKKKNESTGKSSKLNHAEIEEMWKATVKFVGSVDSVVKPTADKIRAFKESRKKRRYAS